jgi:hypothetical protein
VKKLFFVFFIAILMLPVANLTAQEGFPLLSFDIGQSPRIAVTGGSALATDSVFGLNVRVAGPMIVSFTNYGATQFVKVKFDINQQLRAVLGYTGTATVATAGLGFEIVPFRRVVNGLFTEFKLSPFYSFASTAVASGDLRFPLALSIGF